MQTLTISPIGVVQHGVHSTQIIIKPAYRQGLLHLNDFCYINVLWWFHRLDKIEHTLIEDSPYKDAPETLGTFATRSPYRPNPIALSCCEILNVEQQKGIIEVSYIDAEEGSPILDIKPYMPSLDRVESPKMPEWNANWPMSIEDSATFDWNKVFNF